MQFGFNLPISGTLAAPEIMTPHRARRREAGLRLPDRDRPPGPCPTWPSRATPIPRAARSLFARHAVPPRAARLHRVSGRGDLAAAPRTRGDGGAASAGRVHREDGGDDRRAVGRAAHAVGIGAGWLKAEFRRRRDHPVRRRARRRHRRIPRRVPPAVDRGEADDRRQVRAVRPGPPSSTRSRHRTRCRSGSAAKAAHPCAAPPNSPTPGTRSAPTTSICSTACPATRPGSRGCASFTEAAGRASRRRRADLSRQTHRLRPAAGSQRRRAPPLFGHRRRHHWRHPYTAGSRRHRDRFRFRAAAGSRGHRRDDRVPGARTGAGLVRMDPIASALNGSTASTWRRVVEYAMQDLRRRRHPRLRSD